MDNVCSSEELESWNPSLPTPELEANEFAGELLLPRRLVQTALTEADPSFERILAVASEFETSLTATTYRFLTLTDLACVMIWSTDGKARWFKRSEGFPFFIWLRELPTKESFAGRAYRGESLPNGFQPIAADLWLTQQDAERIDALFEHSISLPNYDAVLTLLWAEFDQSLVLREEPLDNGENDPYNALARKRWPR